MGFAAKLDKIDAGALKHAMVNACLEAFTAVDKAAATYKRESSAGIALSQMLSEVALAKILERTGKFDCTTLLAHASTQIGHCCYNPGWNKEIRTAYAAQCMQIMEDQLLKAGLPPVVHGVGVPG